MRWSEIEPGDVVLRAAFDETEQHEAFVCVAVDDTIAWLRLEDAWSNETERWDERIGARWCVLRRGARVA